MRYALGKPDLAPWKGWCRCLPPGKDRLAVSLDVGVLAPLASAVRVRDAGTVIRSYSSSVDSSSVSETAPRRSASLAEPSPPVRLAGADAELVVQVGQVLLDRGLGDHQVVGDRPRGRRLGEHVARDQRPAQGDEHVALARGEVGRRELGLGRRAGGAEGSWNTSRVWPIRISSLCRNRRVAQMRSPLTHVPFDDPRSVTHQPAAKRSSTACRWLAVASSVSGTSFSAPLPIVERCAASSRRQPRTPEITSICGGTPRILMPGERC